MACRATRRPCGAYLKPTMCRPGSLSTKWTDRKRIAARCLPESERRSVQSLRPLPAACSRTSGDLRSLRHERKLAVPTKPCWRLFSRKNPLRPRSFARQFAPGSCFRFVSAPPSKVRACGNFWICWSGIRTASVRTWTRGQSRVWMTKTPQKRRLARGYLKSAVIKKATV